MTICLTLRLTINIQKIDEINFLLEDIKTMLNTYSKIFEKISFNEKEKISIGKFLFTFSINLKNASNDLIKIQDVLDT